MTSTIVYTPPRGVILFPGDVVTFEDDEDVAWLVVGVKPGVAFLRSIGPPTDDEIYEWIA